MSTTDRTLLREAVQHNTTASTSGVLERVFTFVFGGLVYNQIWEDPRADLEALQLCSTSRVLTIASAGCNALNYLVERPAAITAVDLNHAHIHLTRLKLAAVRHLPTHEGLFRFFGYAAAEGNVELYEEYIRDNLAEETRRFWDGRRFLRRIGRKRIAYFKRDFYRFGVLGYFLRIVHGLARLCGVDSRRLLRARTLDEQCEVFAEVIEPLFENRFMRFIGRSPVFLFGIGIPPRQREALMAECDGDIIGLFRERVRRLACAFPVSDNYFAWQAFGRQYDTDARRAVPDYLRREHYLTVKGCADRVETYNDTVTGRLRGLPAGSLDRFVFLDAQDWMRADQIAEMWEEIARVATPGARILFRTAASASPVESALPDSLRRRFTYHADVSRTAYERDRSAIYGGVHLYTLDEPYPSRRCG